jgi:hypothetical protein
MLCLFFPALSPSTAAIKKEKDQRKKIKRARTLPGPSPYALSIYKIKDKSKKIKDSHTMNDTELQ